MPSKIGALTSGCSAGGIHLARFASILTGCPNMLHRGFHILVAAALLSFLQLSSAFAASVTYSPSSPISFGSVTVGTTSTITVTGTFTPDPGFFAVDWAWQGLQAPFFLTNEATPASNCKSNTCVFDISFSPTLLNFSSTSFVPTITEINSSVAIILSPAGV